MMVILQCGNLWIVSLKIILQTAVVSETGCSIAFSFPWSGITPLHETVIEEITKLKYH